MVAEGRTINKMESNVVMPSYWEPGMFLTGISDNNAEWLGLKPGIWWGAIDPYAETKYGDLVLVTFGGGVHLVCTLKPTTYGYTLCCNGKPVIKGRRKDITIKGKVARLLYGMKEQ